MRLCEPCPRSPHRAHAVAAGGAGRSPALAVIRLPGNALRPMSISTLRKKKAANKTAQGKGEVPIAPPRGLGSHQDRRGTYRRTRDNGSRIWPSPVDFRCLLQQSHDQNVEQTVSSTAAQLPASAPQLCCISPSVSPSPKSIGCFAKYGHNRVHEQTQVAVHIVPGCADIFGRVSPERATRVPLAALRSKIKSLPHRKD